MTWNVRGKLLVKRALIIAGFISTLWSAAAQTTEETSGVVVNSYQGNDNVSYNAVYPQLASDRNGDWLAAWSESYEDDDSALLTTGVQVSRSSDMGATWSNPVTVTNNRIRYGGDHPPRVVHVKDDTWILYWRTGEFSRSADNGDTWSAPAYVTTTTQNIMIESDHNGVVLAAQILNDTDFYLSRSTDAGQTWSAAQAVPGMEDTYSPLNSQPFVVSGGAGIWYALGGVFHTGTEWKTKLFSSTDNGVSWQFKNNVPEQIHDISGRGETVVLVSKFDDPYPHDKVHISTSLDGGATFVQTNLDTAGNQFPALAHDSAGNWVTLVSSGKGGQLNAWHSNDALSWTAFSDPSTSSPINTYRDYAPGGIAAGATNQFLFLYQGRTDSAIPNQQDFDIAIRSTSDGGLSWTEPGYVNPNALTDTTRVSDRDFLMSYGDGTIIGNWNGMGGNGAYPDLQTLMVTRSTDNGISWSDAQVLDTQYAKLGYEESQETKSASSSYEKPIYNGNKNWYVYRSEVTKCLSCIGTTHTIYGFSSSDDGSTWAKLPSASGYLVAGNHHGVLLKASATVDEQTQISKSLDGGLNWQSTTVLPVATTIQLVHSAGSDWVALGSDLEVFRLQNDGASWTSEGTAHELAGLEIRNLSSNHQGTIVASGTVSSVVYDSPVTTATVEIYTSVSGNGGISWSKKSLVYSQVNRGTVEIPDPDTQRNVNFVQLFAYPETYFLGGNHWVFVSNVRTQGLTSEADQQEYFKDSNIFIADSPNGGLTWGPVQKILAFNRETGPNKTNVNGRSTGVLAPSYCLADRTIVSSRPQSRIVGGDLEIISWTTSVPNSFSGAQDWQLFD